MAISLSEEWQRREGRLYNELMSHPKITKVNKKYLEEHINHLKAEGKDVRSIIRHLYGMQKLIEGLGYNKDLKKVDRHDIEKAIAQAREHTPAYSEETKLHFFGVWKVFYKGLLGEGLYYPPFIAWLKLTNKHRRKLIPEDILSEEEIIKMLDATTNLRDKLFVMLIYESGCRISEIMGLRKKDIDLQSQPAKITVTGKTGWRVVPILLSTSLLSTYLNLEKSLQNDEVIWKIIATNGDKDASLSYAAARKLLKTVANRAGVTKPVNPHSFRKARASHLANKLSDQQLKQYFGWVAGSDVVEHYVKLNSKDLSDAYMKINGLQVKEDTQQPLLKVKSCSRCTFPNSLDMLYCGRCGSPLDLETAINTERMQKLAVKSAVNDKALDDFVMDYIKQKYLNKKRR